MKLYKNKDIVSGTALMLFASWLFMSSFGIKVSAVSKYGATLVPKLTACIIFILGALVVIDAAKVLKANVVQNGANDRKTFQTQLPIYLTFVALAIYVLLIEKVGFLIMTAFYLFSQMFILSCFEKKKILLYMFISVFSASAMYIVFRNFFNLLLPAGILG